MSHVYAHLLTSERESALLVEQLGIPAASRLLEKIGNHVNQRAEKYNRQRSYFDYVFTAIGVAHQRELNLMHKLKIGLSLVDTENTPVAAHQRVLNHIAERNARRAMKKSA